MLFDLLIPFVFTIQNIDFRGPVLLQCLKTYENW